MEIERRFRITELPDNALSYPYLTISQGYLNTSPTVRIRQENDTYYMTYKSSGAGLAREEYNLPLNKESYEHLALKTDGYMISKKRYLIPDDPYTIELDIFEGIHASLMIAEVEFPTEEAACAYRPPLWFGEELTGKYGFSNAYLSQHEKPLY